MTSEDDDESGNRAALITLLILHWAGSFLFWWLLSLPTWIFGFLLGMSAHILVSLLFPMKNSGRTVAILGASMVVGGGFGAIAGGVFVG